MTPCTRERTDWPHEQEASVHPGREDMGVTPIRWAVPRAAAGPGATAVAGRSIASEILLTNPPSSSVSALILAYCNGS